VEEFKLVIEGDLLGFGSKGFFEEKTA